MSFVEFVVCFVAWTYVVWGHLGLDTQKKAASKQAFVPTRRQNKVINKWVRHVSKGEKQHTDAGTSTH